jgi:hypothetical protein
MQNAIRLDTEVADKAIDDRPFFDYVGTYECKSFAGANRIEIRFGTGEQVIDPNDVGASLQVGFDKVRADETGGPGHEDNHDSTDETSAQASLV